jgi:hypothetical protein
MARIGDNVDQTKDPKKIKAPAINQLRAGGSGGVNTAGFGGLNYDTSNTPVNKSGQPIPTVLPSLVVAKQPTSQPTSTRGGVANVPTINSMLTDIGRTTRPALANNVASNTPAVPAITPDTSITSPAQIGQRPNLPNSNSLTQLALASNVDPNKSYMTADNGVKTLNVAGGTISSSSPNFGNSSVKRLADLDQTLANDKNTDIIAHRAESAALADQRYNDAYRGGLSRSEYENPNGVTQLGKRLDQARASGDYQGVHILNGLLKEQMGNATTLAGQDQQNRNAQLTSQIASQKLGFDMAKSDRDFEANQSNKGIDQSIEVQKAQSNIDKGINEQYNNPANMAASWSPSQSFEFVASQNGNIGAHLGKIVGPQNAEEIRKEPDITRRAQRLQSLGLSPDQVKQLLTSLQQ